MRNLLLMIASVFVLLSSCTDKRIGIVEYTDEEISIWPDYKGVTIPYNIAPLSFSVDNINQKVALIIKTNSDSIIFFGDDGCFNLPQKEWRGFLNNAINDSIQFTICVAAQGGWKSLKPFWVYVSEDEIDSHLVYRRITPGYGLWNRMSLCQRCLQNYEEKEIYRNEEGKGNCINCHSFCNGNPEKWQMHIRTKNGGTYLFDGQDQSLLSLKDKSNGNPVYANWHPNGELIAYSNNNTFFLIHTVKTNRWEVMDDGSDVFVADIKTGEQYRSNLISSKNNYETFPCFSPDGKFLYFTSAEANNNLINEYDSVQYNICRITFDAETRSFGSVIDTLYNAKKDGGSASFPRISPDGRWLCFTRSSYGNFSICHRDADLCMIDLSSCQNKFSHSSVQNDEPVAGNQSLNSFACYYEKLEIANSDQVESYHSWSRNSRWLVFSSKRDDAIYTKPYFVHIDEEGRASKPFLLPQLDAKNYYDLEMVCYNLPELVSGEVPIRKIRLAKTPQGGPQTQISVN